MPFINLGKSTTEQMSEEEELDISTLIASGNIRELRSHGLTKKNVNEIVCFVLIPDCRRRKFIC